MREIINEIEPWFTSGEPFALATVTGTWGSAPRPVGAAMAVSRSGEIIGSVSGGCVEGAVFDSALEVLETEQPQKVTFGVSDENAFSFGLTCGGTIELFIQIVGQEKFPHFQIVYEAIREQRPIAIATLIDGPGVLGSHIIFDHENIYSRVSGIGLDQSIVENGRIILSHGKTATIKLPSANEATTENLSILIESYIPAPKMILFGAIGFAAALARMGKFLGYHVTICDARALFTTRKRFPEADEVIVEWPHRYLSTVEIDARTVICVLTHDSKFDVPALEMALRSNARYVGALGSRRTHNDRLRRLREIGMTESELARLHSPIGLDLGSKTPEETAVSIAAEIISDLTGASRQPLSEGIDSIHKDFPVSESEIST